jgi:hypothetical protein
MMFFFIFKTQRLLIVVEIFIFLVVSSVWMADDVLQPRFYDNNNSVYIKGISEKKRWGKMFVDVKISVEGELFAVSLKIQYHEMTILMKVFII